jgi:hypothetical protein
MVLAVLIRSVNGPGGYSTSSGSSSGSSAGGALVACSLRILAKSWAAPTRLSGSG